MKTFVKILYVLKKLSFVKHYDYVFCSGKNGIVTIGVGYNIDNLNSKLVQINSFDYDKFIENKSNIYFNDINPLILCNSSSGVIR